jgi:hypothetical protein
MGTNYDYVEEFPVMPSERELDESAWEYALENAESFGTVFEDYDVEGFDEDDSRHFLMSDIDGWWEVYDPAKHDDILGRG